MNCFSLGVGAIGAACQIRQFWEAARSGMQEKRIFIDQARAAKIIWSDEYTGDGSITSYTGGLTWPQGLEQGGADPGTLGKVTLSQQVIHGGNIYYGTDVYPVNNEFWEPYSYSDGGDNSVLEVVSNTINGRDCFFKFRDDPENDIYKVLVYDPASGNDVRWRSTLSGVNLNYYQGGATTISSNYTNPAFLPQGDPDAVNLLYQDGIPAGTYNVTIAGGLNWLNWPNHDGNRRNSIQFEFRKINKDTNQVTTEGINPDVFDPRAALKHDGMSNIEVTFMSRDAISGDIKRPAQDRAVWETEQKDDTEQDIYYEASQTERLV